MIASLPFRTTSRFADRNRNDESAESYAVPARPVKRFPLTSVIGKSRSIRELLALVESVAASEANILV